MLTRTPIPEEVLSSINYDPDTGEFTWARDVGRKIKAGSKCGILKGAYPHVIIGFGGRQFQAHRIAWFLMTGQQPPDTIDHVDGDGGNNRWSNLREATAAQNGANRRSNRDLHSKGVHHFKGRWQAYIKIDGKKRHLGCFGSEPEARAAYQRAAIAAFGEFARAA